MDSNAANDKAVLDKQATVANQSTESLDNLDESELEPRKASKLPAAKKKKKKTKKKDAVKVTENDSLPLSVHCILMSEIILTTLGAFTFRFNFTCTRTLPCSHSVLTVSMKVMLQMRDKNLTAHVGLLPVTLVYDNG